MGESDPLFLWMIGLFIIAAGILVLEVFIPSGGILGGVAFLCAVAAIIAGFRHSNTTGFAALGFLLLAAPVSIWMLIKIFPHTPIGHRLILSNGDIDGVEDDMLEKDKQLREESSAIQNLIGARGKSVTYMRPGGTIIIDNEEIEAFAELGMIDVGVEVEVTRIVNRQIKVRAIEND